MRKLNLLLSFILGLALFFSGCAAKKMEPKPENFLTLADLSGRVNLKEDSPGVRVSGERPKRSSSVTIYVRQKPKQWK